MPAIDGSGRGTLSAAIEAINYAWRNGAAISNASWGMPQFSEALGDAIEAAGDFFAF